MFMMIRKKESIKRVQKKAEVNDEKVSDNEQCTEGADDKHEKRGDNGGYVQASDDNGEQKKQ